MAAKVDIIVPHNLSREQALERLRLILNELRAQFAGGAEGSGNADIRTLVSRLGEELARLPFRFRISRPREEWDGDQIEVSFRLGLGRFSLLGSTVSVLLTLEQSLSLKASIARLCIDIPLMAMPFRAEIEAMVQRYGEALLADRVGLPAGSSSFLRR
ncbi:MAG: hypothetical protein HYS89_00300 [Candidatus Colwellbacteria bacterium]|nr:hypothetical protein [Candidatus Colwellbacteria bacterium]